MKLFIWEFVDMCSDRYHSEGGVVVIAKTEEAARIAANKISGCKILDSEDVDFTVDVESEEEKVFIFPDAGCC